jgi:CHAT domain-containing protein/Tfp pilus assembly protein PilF
MARPVESILFSPKLLKGKSLGLIFPALSLSILLASTTLTLAHKELRPHSRPSRQASDSGAVIEQDTSVSPLEPGKPIERELTAGETHAYTLTLSAGQYAQVLVDQRGINVAVTAFAPDGKKIVEYDMFAIGDAEVVSLTAETATSYRLEVRAPERDAPKGRYEIKLKELRAATEQDQSLIAADRLIAEGILLRKQPAAASWRTAIDRYQQSIPLCQSAKNPACEAVALYLISGAYIALGEKQKAFDFANHALPLAHAAAGRPGEEDHRIGIRVEANTLDAIGQIHIEFGDKKKALELFNQALPLRQASGDHVGEVNTVNNIGMAYGYMGEGRKALEFFERASLLVRALGDIKSEASVLNNMCVVNSNLGEYKKALGFCNRVLSIRRGLADRQGEALVLNNIGTVHSSLGEYQEALDSHNQALAIYQDSHNRHSEAITLNNIAWVYGTLGEYQQAIGIYNRAAELLRGLGDRYREAVALGNIAANYAKLGEYQKALAIGLQVLPMRVEVHDQEGEANTLAQIANCYQNLGERQKALNYYDKALAGFRALGKQRLLVTTLDHLGAFYRDLGEPQKAMAYLGEGLQVSRTIGDRNGEAGVLANIALVERDRGNLVEARTQIEEALKAVESLRINVKSHQLRTSFFASVRRYYEFNINLLMRLDKERPSRGFGDAALEASERARARSLLELLTEAGAEIRAGVDPSLIERERVLRQSISDRADNQTRLLSGEHTEGQATAAAQEMDALTTEYEQVQAQIRQTSPQYAALTRPVPLSLKEIQSGLLDQETVLLEYALGEEKSFLWAVTPGSMNSYELPGRAEIEAAARRVYDLITAPDHLVPNESLEQRRKRLDQADAEYPVAAAVLSRILLGPAASELKDKRLLIVGEGVLQYVPFAALPEPAAAAGQSSETKTTAGERQPANARRTANAAQQIEERFTPLVVHHEIVSLPSASVLEVLRREAKQRARPSKALAVFADPVFDTGDSRLALAKNRPAANNETAPSSEVRRSAEESGLNGFPRLRFSRQEADQIMRFASRTQSLEALDFAANRAVAISPQLQQFRIVHFATHGLINNQHAELSGIVLSLVDERGQAQNGFVRLYDVYNMNLKAELVVLSACQTALGKDIKGEGLVGLTRAFMYAGATRVMASLWQTEDRSTAVLMDRFYEGMLGDHLSPAAALRNAQVSMWKDKRWRQPRYWAAFTLQGEWK